MKKKVMFVIPSLESGGAEKSLLTLLSLFDYEKYEVDLFAFNPSGMIKDMLPDQVNLLDLPTDYIISKLPLHKSVLSFLKRGKIRIAIDRIKYSMVLRKYGYSNKAEQYAWKHMKKFLTLQQKKYDVAIGYLEKTSNYYVVDMVNSNTKIAYIHSDYEKLNTDKSFDKKYFEKTDFTVTVSQSCSESLKNNQPSVAGKIRVIENIVSKETILDLSKEGKGFERNDSNTIILTVGRLSKEKGVDLAIEACKLLLVDGYKIKWYHIGDGNWGNKVKKMIEESNLIDTFILLGLRSNPYPFIASCDVFVQPSRYEGKSIAIEEAKVLGKPIVCTAFSTVHDQIEDEVTGFISEIDSVSIAKKIKTLIDNPVIRETVAKNAALYQGNENEIQKLYDLFKQEFDAHEVE
ncbi:MAG TPA: glycosyltransferase [Clostridia bacterium]|nr:glycosyltransferase [Clostridia bacterium]